MNQNAIWRSRIVASEDADPKSLVPNAGNWRVHPEQQRSALKGVLSEVGWVARVIVNRRTGRIIDGHLRVAEAVAHGELTIPVDYVDLDENEEALVLATFDPLTALAEADEAKLRELLDRTRSNNPSTQELLDRLRAGIRTPSARDEAADAPAPAPPVVPCSRRGDVWLLGRHRLMCGDSTDAADVATLLSGAKPNLMVTDPPYGVEYDPEWRQEAAEKGLIGFSPSALGKVANDDRVDWREAWNLFTGSVAYVWHAGIFAAGVSESLNSSDFVIRAQIIWSKPSFAISRGHYNWQHEPCWYAVRRGRKSDFVGSHSEPTVWPIGRAESNEHGTQKPLECMARPIRNHRSEAVYDPFLGSGTTLMACETLGRQAFAMELEPAYVDVAIARFQAAFAQEVRLDIPPEGGGPIPWERVRAERLGAIDAAAEKAVEPEPVVQPPAKVTSTKREGKKSR